MRIALTLIITAAFLLSSCGNAHEKLGNKMIGKLNKIADVLEDVDDEESAEDAREKLEKLIEDVEEIQEQMNDMDDPDEDLRRKLKKELEPEAKKAVGRIQRQVAGLLTTDYGQKELPDILNQLLD
jgi:protein subunit release factor A